MPKLYELAEAYADVSATLMECESEEEYEAALAAFENISADLEGKALAYAQMYRNLKAQQSVQEAQAKVFKAEYERLSKRAKSTESAADKLKNNVCFAMETAGLERMRTGIGTWYVTQGVAVTVDDVNAIPAEFVNAAPPKPDINAIKKHFTETGELISGVTCTVKSGVQIR